MNAEPVNYVTLTEEKATRINKSETDKIKTRFKKVVFGLSVFEATVTLAIISLASVLVVTQGCQNSKPSDKAESSRGFYYHDYHYDETCSNETLAQGIWCSIFALATAALGIFIGLVNVKNIVIYAHMVLNTLGAFFMFVLTIMELRFHMHYRRGAFQNIQISIIILSSVNFVLLVLSISFLCCLQNCCQCCMNNSQSPITIEYLSEQQKIELGKTVPLFQIKDDQDPPKYNLSKEKNEKKYDIKDETPINS